MLVGCTDAELLFSRIVQMCFITVKYGTYISFEDDKSSSLSRVFFRLHFMEARSHTRLLQEFFSDYVFNSQLRVCLSIIAHSIALTGRRGRLENHCFVSTLLRVTTISLLILHYHTCKTLTHNIKFNSSGCLDISSTVLSGREFAKTNEDRTISRKALQKGAHLQVFV